MQARTFSKKWELILKIAEIKQEIKMFDLKNASESVRKAAALQGIKRGKKNRVISTQLLLRFTTEIILMELKSVPKKLLML